MTLRGKLLLWYGGLLGVILIIFGAALFGVTRWTLIHTIDTSLVATADLVIDNSGVYTRSEFGAPEEVRIQLPELDLFRASGIFVQMWELDTTPTLTGHSTNLGRHTAPLDATVLDSLPTEDLTTSGDIFSDAVINGELYRVMTRPFTFWNRLFAVQTATSMATVNRASREMIVIIAVGMVVAMIGSLAMGMGFANRALTPIDQVTQAAARITETDDLKTRLEYKGPMDEIGRMSSVFNQMMDRLENLFHVQRRFVADVSHELRTPLTAIRGNLDLIKRYGTDEESLEAIESEVERMSRLVSDLLLLARADYGGLTLDFEPLDLDTIVSEVYREGRVLAKDRNITVKIQDFEPIRVQGDADKLKQLFLNLVSNAIKFTPDDGTVTINLRRTPTDAVVEVSDTGIGIGAEDLARIFDRFYQADPARVHKGEGSGLGLSIAKWIAEAHSGQIDVRSEVGTGTTFSVTIPHIEQKPTSAPAAATRPRINLIGRSRGS